MSVSPQKSLPTCHICGFDEGREYIRPTPDEVERKRKYQCDRLEFSDF